MIGISEAGFWNMNPAKLKPYIEADRLRLESRNYELWLQGVYFFDAISIALSNAFREKGKKPVEYPGKPRRITRETPEEQETRAQAERDKAIAFFQRMEKNFKRREGYKVGNDRDTGN